MGSLDQETSVPGARVSVIMAAKNEARFIGQAIEAIEAQTYPPVEIIVVDDGSGDSTGEVARATSSGRIPLRVLRNEHSTGPAAARNLAVSEAGGEWIAVCDGDDVWRPDKLARQMAFIRDWKAPAPIVVLGSKGTHINEAGASAGCYDPGFDSLQEFERAVAGAGVMMIGHSSAIYRRSHFWAVGGYASDFNGNEDIDLWDRIVQATGGVALNMSEPLFYYRKKRGSVMQATFWRQMVNFARIPENRHRRLAGLEPLGFDEFRDVLAARPLAERLRRRHRWVTTFFYRFGATNMVNGRPVMGGFQLAIAAVLQPGRVLAGVKRYRQR